MFIITGWAADAGSWHAHTAFENVPVDLCDDDIAAKHNVQSLFKCFSMCVANARFLYGVSRCSSQHVKMIHTCTSTYEYTSKVSVKLSVVRNLLDIHS